MNCSTVRHHLLAHESPQTPGAAEARHLAGCVACRAWHQRLVRIEQQLPLVFVPACPVPSGLLDQLQARPRRPAIESRHPGRPRNLEGGRQKLALAFSLAASLAVFTVGWWAWPQQPSTPDRRTVTAPDPYVRQREHRLASATNASQRVKILADWANECFVEVRQKANDPGRLAVLSGQFDRLVQEDLIYHVRQIALADRRAVASSIALWMKQVQTEATRLADDASSRQAGSAASLRLIAASARAAESQLRQFV